VEAAAKLAVDILAEPAVQVPPEVPFRLLAMRHPLLALQQKNVVPNDVAFTEQERVLVVSGPNAGGKTVTLSGVGLCSLMLRAGLFIPAERGSTRPSSRRAVGHR
jgi:DNA mismatch repair protein MutS2